ncbi:MAG: AtuA-related protein [Acidimicrobiales bacterium]
MAGILLRDLCGVRSGDKGDISDLSLFADTPAAYEAIRAEVTADRVRAHFGDLVKGEVERYEVPNVLALKFVLHDALGGGAPRSLRADNLGKTLGAALLRMEIEVPDDVAMSASRRDRAPLRRD